MRHILQNAIHKESIALMHCVFHISDCFVKERERRSARAISATPGSRCGAHRADNGTAGTAGGANRDRTDDLLLAKQALSQLSYGPINGGSGWS